MVFFMVWEMRGGQRAAPHLFPKKTENLPDRRPFRAAYHPAYSAEETASEA